MNKRRLLSITQSLNHSITAWWLFPGTAWACPLCKEILTDPGQVVQKLATAKGYAASILLMLSVPALLIGGVTLLVVRSHRRKPLG